MTWTVMLFTLILMGLFYFQVNVRKDTPYTTPNSLRVTPGEQAGNQINLLSAHDVMSRHTVAVMQIFNHGML